MTRRRFVWAMATGTGILGFLPASLLWVKNPKDKTAAETIRPLLVGPFESFTSYQATIVHEVSGLIIPTDQDPGAKEAQVVNEIDQIVKKNDRYHEIYRLGIDWLDKKAKESFGKESFLDVPFKGQMHILELAETRKLSRFEKLVEFFEFGKSNVGKRFFELVKKQTFTAFYTHPIGWQVVAFQGPPQWSGHLDYSHCV